MNKLFTKIAALALGMTMATGVGVAVASSGKEASPADAASSQWQLVTSAPSDWSGEYILGNGTSGTIKIMDGSSFSSSSCAGIDATVSSSKITADTADALTIAKSSTSGKYTVKLNGKFIGKNANSNGIDANATWSSSLDNDITYSSSKVFIKGNGGRVLTWYASNSNFRYYASSNNNSQLYKKVESKTLSSITLGGSYTTEFTVGDTFNHTGMTVTAHYSDSTTATVTSSATWSSPDMSTAGQKTVTVSYTESSTTKTADYTINVSAATTPTIALNGSSFSGFTGQSFSVTATYSNLTSAFDWSTSGSGTTTETITSTGTSTDGTSTYSGTLTGAGTKTLTATGGGVANPPTYTVTITKVTVDITKASTSIAQGKSETLAASHNASAVDGLTWESSDTSGKISVDSNGKVTVANNATVGATATITATSKVDTSVSDTCTVTVAEAPLEDVLDSTVIPAAAVGSSTSSWGTASTFSDYTGAVYTGRFMGVSSSSFIGRLNDSTNGYIYTSTVPSNMKLKSVTIESMTASKTVGVYAQSGAYTAAPSDKSTALGTITPSSLTYEFAEDSNYNAICLRGHTSATEIGTVTIEYEALAVLDNVTSSGQTTLFTAGNKFAYGGTLTAHYTGGKADATVSPAYFKFGASGINPTSAGTAITTSDDLSVGTHNGKYIYVVYTEDTITKWASYQITVNYAPVTSVVIDTHAAEIGLNETYDYNLVGVTVNTSYADQGYEWIVHANTVGDDYTFDGSGLKSKDTEGTITLWCRSTADNSKYDELVVTVTGDPTAEFTPSSVSGYVGKSADVAFTYGNIDDESLISVSSSNTSAVTVEEIIADENEGLVTINFVASGNSTLSISYDGGAALDTVVVTVSNDSVVALNWTASNIKVYSGAVLPVAIEDTWMVNYEMASGDADFITYGDYSVKLGNSTITLPHTWSAEDDGKTLCVEYLGFESSTVTVDVTQTLRPIMASDTSSWDFTFESKAWSAKGDWTIGEKLWNMSGTDDGSPYFGYDATKGQQFGSGTHPFSDVSLQSSAFSGTVDSVTVYTSGANSINATVQVSVGGTAYGSAQTITNANAPYTFDLGGKSGTISIDWVNSSSKAIYVKEIVVRTVSGSHDIANIAGHEAAQKAVVKFAKAFNTAMDTTSYCTTNMSSAWSTATAAWNTFINTDIASLSAAEQAYAKNLIKYATAQWTEGTDSNYEYCLERAMATYERCVSVHEMTAFMSSVRPVGRVANTNPISLIGSTSSNAVAIIIIVSVISVSAIGGYFFLRKKREN